MLSCSNKTLKKKELVGSIKTLTPTAKGSWIVYCENIASLSLTPQ